VTTTAHVIELFGLPGAGKSRLSERIVEDCAVAGVTVTVAGSGVAPEVPTPVRVARKAGLAVAEMVAGTSASRAGLLGITRSARSAPAEAVGRCLQWLVTQRLLTVASRRHTVQLLDEGLLQALWSVGLRGDLSTVMRYLDGAPLAVPDLVLLVDCPPDLAAARLNARSSQHSRVQAGHSAAALLPELVKGRRLVETVSSWWAGRAGEGALLRLETGPDGVPSSGRARVVDRIVARKEPGTPT
jgi:hypothetical protein